MKVRHRILKETHYEIVYYYLYKDIDYSLEELKEYNVTRLNGVKIFDNYEHTLDVVDDKLELCLSTARTDIYDKSFTDTNVCYDMGEDVRELETKIMKLKMTVLYMLGFNTKKVKAEEIKLSHIKDIMTMEEVMFDEYEDVRVYETVKKTLEHFKDLGWVLEKTETLKNE
jgi:hypothetical protein